VLLKPLVFCPYELCSRFYSSGMKVQSNFELGFQLVSVGYFNCEGQKYAEFILLPAYVVRVPPGHELWYGGKCCSVMCFLVIEKVSVKSSLFARS
jgi:hypothetical protein